MAYFPFYVELKDVSVLIVGGGKVALHKVKRILDYGPKIKVVAKKVDERIKNIKGVEWEEREFEDSDVEGVRFVIAAAGDEELDEHITSLCNDKGIKYITGVGKLLTGYLLTYDAINQEFHKIKLPSNTDGCAVCGSHPTITELIDYEQVECTDK